MSEFFRNRFDDIFKINYDGDIFKLHINTGEWEKISEFNEIDIFCKPCSNVYINSVQLAIYFKRSEAASIAGGGRPFGKNFSFFDCFGQIYSIDENDNEYICKRDFMYCVDKGTVNKKWVEIPSDNVFNKIKSLDSFFIKEMELYIFEAGDIELFSKSFSNSVSEDIMTRFRNLYSYITKSYNNGITSGKDFIFYKDDFGCIYAKDENYNEYICKEDFLVPINKKSIKNTWDIVDKYYVTEFIKKHAAYIKELPSKKIEIQDLKLYINKKGHIGGITEDGREFRLSDVTGEIEAVGRGHGYGRFWKRCSKIQAVKFQFKKKEEYKGITELNEYIKKCDKEEFRKNGKHISKKLSFFKNDFGRIFAKSNDGEEYICEENYMILLVNKGNARYLWEPVEQSQVPYMIRAYADMVREICEKNKNLKEIHKYIKENEKKELEKTGKAFGYSFRFFINNVGYVFAKDEKNREYFCNSKGMSFIKNGTIDERNWDSILESDVIKYLR